MERRGAVVLLAVAIAGAIAVDRATTFELERIREARALLETRDALETGARPIGALTIVSETQSAKYSFLNKRRYVVHTSSSAREGTALRADEDFDKGRADRHAEVRRKGVPLKAALEDGSYRITLSRGLDSAELRITPPPVPRPAPWIRLGIVFLLSLTGFWVASSLGSRPLIASIASLLTLVLGTMMVQSMLLAEASQAASEYLLEVHRGAPRVTLPLLRSAIYLSVIGISGVGVVVFLSGGRASRAVDALYRDRSAYAAIAPALVGLLVLVGMPFLYGVGLSLFSHVHGTFEFVGLSNFKDILLAQGRHFFEPGTLVYALSVNVIWTVSNVSLHLIIGLVLALLLQKHATRFSKVYRVFLILPWAVPSYLTALIWRSMFDPDLGAINRILGLEGMSWMHDVKTAFLANLMANVWLGFPFMMVVCLGALTSIPKDLYEAAEVDGAGAWHQLVTITLPLLKPALLPAAILGSIWTFNRFEVIYLVSEGRPDGATDILVTEAYRWAFERGLAQGGAYGYAAAYSVIIFSVLLLYAWMTSRVARSAEETLR